MKKCNRKRLNREQTFSKSVSNAVRKLNTGIGNYQAVQDRKLRGGGRTYENGEIKGIRFDRSWRIPQQVWQ